MISSRTNQIISSSITIINMGKVTRKDLLDSGLTGEFIIGFDIKFEEYQISPECIFMLANYIKEHGLIKKQQNLIAKYIRQLLQHIRENPSKWKQFLLGGGIGLMSSVGTGAAVTAVGFTAGGVAAGSIAAGMQAVMGAVPAGSAFATAQSMGATGAFFGPAGLLAGTDVGLGVVGAKFVYDKVQDNKKWEQENKQILSLCKKLES